MNVKAFDFAFHPSGSEGREIIGEFPFHSFLEGRENLDTFSLFPYPSNLLGKGNPRRFSLSLTGKSSKIFPFSLGGKFSRNTEIFPGKENPYV